MIRAPVFALALGLGLLVATQGSANHITIATEPNNTFGTAQVIGPGAFDRAFNPNIFDSTTIDHATITRAGANGGNQDWFRFNLAQAGLVHLDIDSSPTNTNFDTHIGLFDAAGNVVTSSDDNGGDPGDGPGIIGGAFNSRISVNLPAGDYVVGVGAFFNTFSNGGTMSNSVPQGGEYTLHISANQPEPTSILAFGMAAVGLCGYGVRRMRKAA